jgi:hypothetical protein
VNRLSTRSLDWLEQKLPRLALAVGAFGTIVISGFLIAYIVFNVEPARGTTLFEFLRFSAYAFVVAVIVCILHNALFLTRRLVSGRSWQETVAEYRAKYDLMNRFFGGAGGGL